MRRIFILFLIAPFISTGQVGINTTNPTATLEVVGDMRIDRSIFLENPGEDSDIRNSQLLSLKIDGNIAQYDIDQSKYGPINYVQYVLRNTSKIGVQDFDTKINVQEYTVTVQGFYFLSANEDFPDSTDVMIQNETSIENIEGFQFYAYENTATGTWFIRAFVNNSEFQALYADDLYRDSFVNIYLNLIIYRQELITKKPHPVSIQIDMGNTETATAPLPAGF